MTAMFASATDYAIRTAVRSNTIRMIERPSRLGGTFVAIEDEHGVIEVADDWSSAIARVKECTK